MSKLDYIFIGGLILVFAGSIAGRQIMQAEVLPDLNCRVTRTIDVPAWVNGEKSYNRIETRVCAPMGNG